MSIVRAKTPVFRDKVVLHRRYDYIISKEIRRDILTCFINVRLSKSLIKRGQLVEESTSYLRYLYSYYPLTYPIGETLVDLKKIEFDVAKDTLHVIRENETQVIGVVVVLHDTNDIIYRVWDQEDASDSGEYRYDVEALNLWAKQEEQEEGAFLNSLFAFSKLNGWTIETWGATSETK